MRFVAGLVVSLSLAACATQASQSAPREERARYGELVTRTYNAEGPGAAILVARGDTVLFRGARGEADIGTHAALRPDSVFRIGSVTKQFSAAALLTLVDDGRARLDDPLSLYLPDFPNGDRITLRQLLNHTAGVRNFNGLPHYMAGIERDLTTAEIVDLFRNEPADFAPGESWDYSNSGYVLIGAVIESVTGMAWHEYLDQRIFRPLGMRHTGYGHDPRFAAQQVHGYRLEGDAVAPAAPMSMTQPHAAGALVSNVDDLMIWMRALHEGRVLRDDTYALMVTPEGAAAAEGVRYGFGLFETTIRGRRVLQHGGRIFGFIASLTYVPDADVSVVVLENDDAHNGPEQADALARRFVGLALGEPYPDMTPAPIDAATLQALEGVYDFGEGVTRALRLRDGRLTSQRGNGPVIALTPIAADDFLYEGGFSRLRIERDASGGVANVRHFANGDGAGVRGVRTDADVHAVRTGLQLPLEALQRFTGVYENNEVSLTVFLEGNELRAQIPDQPAFRLLATSAAQFDVEGEGATIEFSSGPEPAAEAIIVQGGRQTVLRRTQ